MGYTSKFKGAEIDVRLEKMVNVTYAELVALRDEGKLIAGQMYRMTDYETTCTWENTQVAGHPFDLVLTALDNKTLDEKCSAIWSERDTDGYFANSNLAAWDVRYCLDNDTNRFDWALMGGTIVKISAYDAPFTFDGVYTGETFEIGGVEYYMWAAFEDGEIAFPFLTTSLSLSVGDVVYLSNTGESIDGTGSVVDAYEQVGGKGVIYRLIDESENSVPYDFKNIMFMRPLTEGVLDGENGIETFCYTFSCIQDDLTIEDQSVKEPYCCYNNKFASNCVDNVFLTWYGESCYSNTFGESCYSNTFGESCYSNTFGKSCYSNTFGKSCSSNTFGDNCYSNTLGKDSSDNVFGNDCGNNTLVGWCTYITFSGLNTKNTLGQATQACYFGLGSSNNILGSQCVLTQFGNYCERNNIGSSSKGNRFNLYCSDNTIGENSHYNVFDDNCIYNTLANNCSSNTFQKACDHNNLGVSGSGFYAQNITFGDDCRYINLTSDSSGSMSAWIEYYSIFNVRGKSSSQKTEIVAARKRTYQTYVTTKKDGTVVEYTVDDILNAQSNTPV